MEHLLPITPSDMFVVFIARLLNTINIICSSRNIGSHGQSFGRHDGEEKDHIQIFNFYDYTFGNHSEVDECVIYKFY